MSSGNPYMQLAAWLEKEASEIREIEREADHVLHNEGDEDAYRELMRAKALKLASLEEQSVEIVQEENPALVAVMKRIKRFSQSAAQSLRVGSVFFMSALLYPENYKHGERNDLENFVDELRSLASSSAD